MKKIVAVLFAVLFAVLSLHAFSQIPDYVPTDGLVAWYPFDQNFQDESDFGNDAVENGSVPFTDDRFENGESALSFSGNGNNFLRVNYSSDSYTFQSGFSASVWFTSNTTSGNRRVFSMGSTDASGKGFHVMKYSNEIGAWFCEGPGDPYFGNWDGNENTTFDIGEWNHLLFSCDFGNLSWTVFLNGDSVNGGTSGIDFDPNQLPVIFTQTFEIGRKSGTSNSGDAWNGLIDDLGIWSRPLTALEAEALYLSFNGIGGCTDSTACNYDASANWNDGTCLPSGCMDDQACNYNAAASCEDGSCDYSCCPGPGCCGAGTTWNWTTSECDVANPSDSNFDGCVQLNDLLDLLGAYGQCSNEQPCEAVSHEGYEYATVQIDGQCWFAENLRTTTYANGDSIDAGLNDAAWGTTAAGARTTFGEGSSDIFIGNDDEVANAATYGHLYNAHAVTDARGLCPTGWHVPTDAEWMDLELALGMPADTAMLLGLRGTDEGAQIKSTSLWADGGNGTNASGFAGLPAGIRATDGSFQSESTLAVWWSSTPHSESGQLLGRAVYSWNDQVSRGDAPTPQEGYSVRCLRD